MNQFLDLVVRPAIVYSDPSCSFCALTLQQGENGWVCPSCGTRWAFGAPAGSAGCLFRVWSRKAPGGPRVTPSEAYRVSGLSPEEVLEVLAAVRGKGAQS